MNLTNVIYRQSQAECLFLGEGNLSFSPGELKALKHLDLEEYPFLIEWMGMLSVFCRVYPVECAPARAVVYRAQNTEIPRNF